VLGLSPLPLPPYLAGTVAGMAVWSVFYASLGGASRSLLVRGVEPQLLVADLLERAGEYTQEAALGGSLLAAALALAAATRVARERLAGPAAGGKGDGGTGARDEPSTVASKGGSLGRRLGDALSRSAAAGKRQLGGQLSAGSAAGKELGSELGEQLGRTTAAGRRLVSKGLKEWRAAVRRSRELAERYEE
jgi:hypothetical protein